MDLFFKQAQARERRTRAAHLGDLNAAIAAAFGGKEAKRLFEALSKDD